jgi:SHS2 domain-containing protein
MTLTGYREHAHTADWELEVWAPDLPALLETAARGMYAISGTRLGAGPRPARTLELSALDAESLLVRFLGELLWLGQQDQLAFDTFELDIEQPGPDAALRLHANLQGAPLVGSDKEIKAVTYHNLAIRCSERGLQVNIVFDV